jgi:hypothetical protein
MARLPIAGFFEFANFALDDVSLQHAEVGDKQNPIEVVDLVAEGAAKKSFATNFELFSSRILGANGDPLRAGDITPKAGQRQAAFLFALLPFGVNDFRIGANELGIGILSETDVNHRDALTNPDLRCGKSHPLRRIHGFKHVHNELLQRIVELLDALRGRFEYRVAVFDYLTDHEPSSAIELHVEILKP